VRKIPGRGDALELVMISAEAAPYAKEGGLGDVVGTLPLRLADSGSRVRVYLPLYRDVLRMGHRPVPTGREVTLHHAGVTRRAAVMRLPVGGADFLFIREDALFDRDGIYGPPGGEYPDSAQRFSFLVRAALADIADQGISPDVIHCHDWHTALTPVYLQYGGAPAGLVGAATVLTIHNLGYQGVFDPTVFPSLGLDQAAWAPDCLEHFGAVNFLKAGILKSDAVSTVSPAYAGEITTSEMGFGLDALLAGLGDGLVGILNGIDYGYWDPAEDRHLAAPFSCDRVGGRDTGRSALREELGLYPDPEAPLFAFVGRLVEQKGVDLLIGAIPELVADGCRVVVLGTGDPRLEEPLRRLARSHPHRISVTLGFDEPLARRIYAGSDFFIMPSRFEPCGLGQMIAMRYGSLPVVRSVGGLRDTVTDMDADPETGNGFVFHKASSEGLLEAVRRARNFFAGGRMGDAVARVMALDYSWRRSADLYMGLYTRLAGKTRISRQGIDEGLPGSR
jgi:starch synthase